MKIAFVSDIIYPYSKGGKETRSYDLSRNLAKRGHDVHFYTMKFWEGGDVIKKDGFYLHGICPELPLYKNDRRNIWQGICFGLSCFKLLREDFDVMDADHMVYFHLFPCKLACLLKGKKLVVTWHEVWRLNYWLKYLGKKGILGYMMEKLSSKLPNKIISISKHTTDNLVNGLKINSDKITTIPCGIDFDKIRKIKPSKDKSDVIFVGRLLSHKNVDVLIKAIAILKPANPTIKCVIIGDGPEREWLESLALRFGLEKNIYFKGFLDKLYDVHRLIKSSKCFVLPSTREGFGIVVIEANACGVPVITTNHKDNASKDLIEDGKNGFICGLDKKEIAEKILKGLNDGKEMKEGCVEVGKKYDWEEVVGDFEETYRMKDEKEKRRPGAAHYL